MAVMAMLGLTFFTLIGAIVVSVLKGLTNQARTADCYPIE